MDCRPPSEVGMAGGTPDSRYFGSFLVALFYCALLEVSPGEVVVDQAAAAVSGFCWVCWQVTVAGAREAEAGVEEVLVEEEAVAGLGDLAAAAVEAEALREAGSARGKEWLRNALNGSKTERARQPAEGICGDEPRVRDSVRVGGARGFSRRTLRSQCSLLSSLAERRGTGATGTCGEMVVRRAERTSAAFFHRG